MSKCQTHRNLRTVSLCIYAWRGRRQCFFFRENKVQYLKERKERPKHRLPPLRYCCLFTPPSIIRISEPGLVLNLWLFHDASPHFTVWGWYLDLSDLSDLSGYSYDSVSKLHFLTTVLKQHYSSFTAWTSCILLFYLTALWLVVSCICTVAVNIA